MLNEHNPIAELIHQIQKKWIDEVLPFPQVQLVRWLIKQEESRLYKGFLKLESSEHGSIPDVVVAMFTPFQNRGTYSLNLINDWCKAFKEDKKTEEKLIAKGKPVTWNPGTFLAAPTPENGNADHHLLLMLSSFHKEMVSNSMRLVIALFPNSIQDMEGFRSWLTNLLKKGIPDELSFMIFDHVSEYNFDKVFEKYPGITKSLHLNLDLDGAIIKIAKIGNPNSPEVKLRECILEMGKSVEKNNQSRLHEWGGKALQVTQRSGLKSMYATAHIIYAGMLYNFKQFDKIDFLLNKGLAIAQQGLKTEGAACILLVIQFYGYIAASRQLQKKMAEAITAFEKQGELATEHKMPGMALQPYQQAYTLSKKHLPRRYDELIQKAFSTGKSLPGDEQLYSIFPAIAFDFMQWQQVREQWEEAKQTDHELIELFGADWRQKAKNPGAAYINNPAAKELELVN